MEPSTFAARQCPVSVNSAAILTHLCAGDVDDTARSLAS
jgi:hypothetical protein